MHCMNGFVFQAQYLIKKQIILGKSRTIVVRCFLEWAKVHIGLLKSERLRLVNSCT